MTKSFTSKSLTSKIRDTGLALGLAAIVSIASTSASFAFSAEAQQMCTGDAMRLCSSEIPDVDRVTACMVRQRALLSDGCKAVFHYVPPAAAAQPASYTPAAKPAKPLNITPHKRG